MLTADMPLTDAIKMTKEFNAGSMKLILRNGSGEATGAVVILNGIQETREVLDAIEKIEDAWGK